MAENCHNTGRNASVSLNFNAPGLTEEERQERLKTAFDKYFFFGTREEMLSETGGWDFDGFRDIDFLIRSLQKRPPKPY